ncbi:phosphonate metabolism protein/1,5-bisphosphokinase (PRPP-forming) PhnN [Pseudomonas phoenicis]|uniref:phosphonate metabolism protein/1,5-bisphosphokinase (PRPP-forming) PhnN n=1 Tax=unclassified Pseudomonas TaxID=196821 RepID=UPI00399F4374
MTCVNASSNDRGRLILLVGPSGAGKDSLLQAARPALEAQGVRIVRRTITRSPESIGEEALGVSAQTFQHMRAQGEFALHWQANGLCYGIPREVDDWLAAGNSVLVNGSRGHLQQARALYPDLLAICLDVAPGVLRERLLGRGRERPEEVEQRLARNALLSGSLPKDVRHLDNSGALETAVGALLAVLEEEGVITAGRPSQHV